MLQRNKNECCDIIQFRLHPPNSREDKQDHS